MADNRPLCSFFGRCKKGQYCQFAHRPEDVTTYRPLCKYTCNKGNACRYKHVYPLKPPLPVSFPVPAQNQSFECAICNVSCVSFNQLEQHKQGKKHKQLERKACDVKKLENLLDSLELNTKDDKQYHTVKKTGQTPIADDFDSETIIYSPTSIVSNSPICSPSHTFDDSPAKKNRKKSRLNLYCGNCGSKQAWDFENSKQQALTPKRDDDGCFVRSKVISGVTQGCIRFTGRSNSKCSVCDKQIMRSPISAVCVHCNALLGPNWTPYDWRCTNLDGTAPKRFLPPIKRHRGTVNAEIADTIEKTEPCGKYLHSGIAGKLINVDGRVPEEGFVKGSGDCYGFVMIH